MIVDTTNEVVRSGIAGEKTFGFKMTSKAFEIMISGIYSNKPGAVVRELCCNAKDSHETAGKGNVPFKIQIPTELDPNFIVTDFGTGLPPEKIEQLFGTLFDSTKEQSNDSIGAFGLGSKSPFALTDSYSVAGNWNGTKYMYLVFKNENGIPSILETGTEPTNEVNGISVTVPVNPEMCYTFISEVKQQLYMFDPKPIVVNDANFMWVDNKIKNRIQNTLLMEYSNKRFHGRRHSVSMGGVIYPLALEQLSITNQARLEYFQEQTVTIFPIGSVQVQASRESLEYDKDGKTADALNDYFDAMFEEYEAESLAAIAACSNRFESWKYVEKLRKSSTYWGNRPGKLIYKGQVIEAGRGNNSLDYPEFEYESVQSDYLAWGALKRGLAEGAPIPACPTKVVKSSAQGYRMEMAEYHSYQDIMKYAGSDELYSLSFEELAPIETGRTLVVLVDSESNIRRKVKHLATQTFQKIMLVRLSPNESVAKQVGSFKPFIDSIAEQLPHFPKNVVYLSSVVPPKAAANKNTKLIGVITLPDEYTVDKLGEIKPNSVYVAMERSKLLCAPETKPKDLYELTKLIGVSLYGIQKGGMDKLELVKSVGCVEVVGYVEQLLKDFKPDPILVETWARIRYGSFQSEHRMGVYRALYKQRPDIKFLKDKIMYQQDSSVMGWAKPLGRPPTVQEIAINKIINSEPLMRMFRRSNSAINTVLEAIKRIPNSNKEFVANYPIISKMIDQLYNNKDDIIMILDNMKLMDEAREARQQKSCAMI